MLGVGGWKGSNVYMLVAVIVVVAEERDGGEQYVTHSRQLLSKKKNCLRRDLNPRHTELPRQLSWLGPNHTYKATQLNAKCLNLKNRLTHANLV